MYSVSKHCEGSYNDESLAFDWGSEHLSKGRQLQGKSGISHIAWFYFISKRKSWVLSGSDKRLHFDFPKGKPKAVRVAPTWTGGNIWPNVSNDSKPCSVRQPGTPSALYRNKVGPNLCAIIECLHIICGSSFSAPKQMQKVRNSWYFDVHNSLFVTSRVTQRRKLCQRRYLGSDCELRWEYDLAAAAYSINIHPHPRYLGQALADFVKKVPHPSSFGSIT